MAPVGGGGLLSGTAIVARGRGRETLVLGAEVAASPVFTTSLAAGRITVVEVGPTLADGLAGNMESDSRTFEIVRTMADGVALVDERALEEAMREILIRERLVVEGAAATCVGAVLRGAVDLAGRRTAIVLSGRNVDAHVLARLLAGSD